MNDAKSYGSITGGATTSGTTGGTRAFQIKTEPVGAIRGGYRNTRQRGRGSFRGRAEMRGVILEDAIIVTNPILPRNTSQLVQPKMQRVTSAGKRDTTRGLVGKSEIIGEDRQWD